MKPSGGRHCGVYTLSQCPAAKQIGKEPQGGRRCDGSSNAAQTDPHLVLSSLFFIVVFQSFGCVRLCDPTDCSAPGFPVLTISQSSLKLMSTESVMPSNHLILCCPRLLLPSIFPSIRVPAHQWVGSLNQVAKISELQL